MDFIRCDHDTAEPIRDKDGMCILVPPGKFVCLLAYSALREQELVTWVIKVTHLRFINTRFYAMYTFY